MTKNARNNSYPNDSLAYLMVRAPLEFDSILLLAINIVDALDEIHRDKPYYGCLNPVIIQVDQETFQVILPEVAGLGVAISSLDIVNLRYISPEQTGRTNRTVDYRTDLYSLGVVFYELLTGTLPFVSEDPMEMVHSHIAKRPVPPHELKPEIPEQVSAIVMKLLEKNAEDRYQSAIGLGFDLQKCEEQLLNTGKIERFKLEASSFTGIFQTPRKLYGRSDEIKALLGSFERISKGSKELLLVAGYSGIGKTALVHEVQNHMFRKRGYFIEGKFNQYQRNVPYLALGQAFSRLVNQILMEQDDSLNDWKKQVLKAVGPNGKIVTDVIPNLELIIGEQPDVPVLGGQESMKRFNSVFQNFVKVVARKEHPLVVFLDDSQWIDPATLNLQKTLLTEPGLEYFLIIGAYRDNEVDASHPLTISISDLQQNNVRLEQITLRNLTKDHVCTLCADSLHSTITNCKPLAKLIFSKTDGNAFFTHQMLHSLKDDQLITFSTEKQQWQWDMGAIQAMDITDNVVELMTQKVQKLPNQMQDALKLAACIGSQFNSKILAIITESPDESISEVLMAAKSEGLITKLGKNYKFIHDRVQQAAYSLISEADKENAHLKIGRLLLQHIPEPEQEEHLFEIVDQLSSGQALIINPTERIAIAELHLKAGQKALAFIAYKAALNYFKNGLNFLPEDSWSDQYDLTLALYEAAAAAANFEAQFEQSEHFAEQVLQHAHSILDKIRVFEILLQASTMTHADLHLALKKGLGVLGQLGTPLPVAPTTKQIKQYHENLKSILFGKDISALSDLPTMTDPCQLAIMRIMHGLFTPSFFAAPRLAHLMAMEMTRLSVEYGRAPESPVAYTIYAQFLCGVENDIAAGQEFGKLALSILAREKVNRQQAMLKDWLYLFVFHWTSHIRDSAGPMLEVYQDAMTDGEIDYVGWPMANASYHLFWGGRILPTLQQEMEEYRHVIKKSKNTMALGYQNIYRQTVANLVHCTGSPDLLQGEHYDEREMLPLHTATKDGGGIFYLYLCKLMLAYLFGKYEDARTYAKKPIKYLLNVSATIKRPIYIFYDSLAQLNAYPESDKIQRKAIVRHVNAKQKLMAYWAKHAPMNYLHKWHLLEAEKQRVMAGDIELILDHYDKAISLARQSGYIQEEALANELAGKYWLEKDKPEFARLYIESAYACYKQWGAKTKLIQLESQYPEWLLETKRNEDSAVKLDMDTVIKASHAISGEIVLDRLISSMMQIVIENAGARNGFLILEKDGKWSIEAEGDIDKTEMAILQSLSIEKSGMVSPSIVNYVIHTKNTVVLADASNEGDFIGDVIIEKKQSKSILCTPLINQGRLSGILYLENNLTAGTFTTDRVELLNLLSSQIAMALDNARLYGDLEQRVAERTRALSDSEEHYRTLFANAGIGIVLLDENKHFMNVNKQFLDFIGYELDELRSMTPFDIIRQDNIEETRQVLNDSSTTRPKTSQLIKRYIRKDGESRWGDVINTQITLASGKTLDFETIADITLRKQAEEALRKAKDDSEKANQALEESERRLKESQDFAQLGQWELDLVNDKLVWSDGVYKIFEIDKEHFGASYEAFLDAIHPEDRETVSKAYSDSLVNKKPYEIIHRLLMPDGRIKFVREQCRTDYEDGTPLYSIGTVQDITVIKEGEEKLRHANERLTELDKLKSMFIASMSHELRTPLNSILGFTGMTLDGLSGNLNEEQSDNLNRVYKSGKHLLSLISDVIDISKVEAGRIEKLPEEFSLTELIDETSNSIQSQLLKKGLNLEVELSKEIILYADRKRLMQCLLNFLSNAVKYTENGMITVKAFESDDHVEISVSDTGIGIKKEDMPKLFEAFERFESNLKVKAGGTGLGLYLTKKIATDILEGYIQVESEENKGSTFTLKIPTGFELGKGNNKTAKGK